MQPRLGRYRGQWYAIWQDDGTKRASLRTKDRAEAERNFADFLKRWNAPGETIADIMQAYLRDKRRTASDADRLHYAWKRLRPLFGSLLPHQVTRDLCRQYSIERSASAGTIRREFSTLRAGLRWFDPQVRAVFELPPPPPPRERHLSREEYEALVEAAIRTPHVYLFVVLALATAARATALLDLSWNRVDLDRGIIRLGSGTRLKGRATVPITQRASDALREARECALTPFVIEYGGKRVKRIRKAFMRAVERAGLGKDVTPHVLRHTAAVWMAEAGTPMAEIAQYLGHSSPDITYRVYARYSPSYLRGAAQALEG
ncbi:MAG: tyrosine-type recombinase/integrase [Geminicoccaceae bacterium]